MALNYYDKGASDLLTSIFCHVSPFLLTERLDGIHLYSILLI